MAEQIVPHAVKQIGAQAVGAGPGQLPEPGGQGIVPVARVAGFGDAVGVKEQRPAGRERQRPAALQSPSGSSRSGGAGEGTSTLVTDGAAWPLRPAWLFRLSPVPGDSSRGGGCPQL